VTLHDAAGEVVWEGSLVPGREVTDLPANHPHVLTWGALDMLDPIADGASSGTAGEAVTETATRRRAAKEG